MKTTIYSIALTLIMALTAVSCKKDVNGCTSPSATNYNPDATKNDQSCKYEGTVAFWMDGSVTPNGSVTVLLNGEYKTITHTLNSAPTCGAQYTATFTLPVGTYEYAAEDNFPVSYQNTGTLTIEANTCITMLLH